MTADILPEATDRRLAMRATGLLRTFNEAGVLTAADVHVAQRFGGILGEAGEDVLLATAVAVRAVRHGSIHVDLARVAETVQELVAGEEVDVASLPWPEPGRWVQAVRQSVLVREEVLRLEGTRLYLDRYWREERQVCDDLVTRIRREPPEPDEELLADGLTRVFRDGAGKDFSEQRAAVDFGVRHWTTVLTGGPGTGKTTTVAGLLALVAQQHEVRTGQLPRIALCAPTGKAAARLQDAVDEAVAELADESDKARVRGLQSMTMHRLLGWRPGSHTRFRHHRGNRLPHDVVVVDETSMVSLTMMARLLEAVRPDARLILVGDPDQLSSVEAGAVLADLVDGLRDRRDSPVFALRTSRRYGPEIRGLAEALRKGEADRVLAALAAGGDRVQRVDPDDEAAMAAFRDSVADVAWRMRLAAEADDGESALATLHEHRLLCAHRLGPYGVAGWNRLVEQLVAERAGGATYETWYAGRPVLVTANDPGQRLSNGDMGVTVRTADGRLRVLLAEQDQRLFAPTRLPEVETMHAMTVHKSQGSQAQTVSVVMPPQESRLLTRELFYTAVTRAEERVRIGGSEESIRAAVERQVPRASGLAERLRDALPAAGPAGQ
jgi:exodeoxyribonuclease V alpha subunit